MELEQTARVKAEFQELGRLHVEFMKTQLHKYGSSIRVGAVMIYFALFLAAFGIVRLLDGLAVQLIEGTDARVQYVSGGLLILIALILFIGAGLALRKMKTASQQVIQEIREDWRWLRKML